MPGKITAKILKKFRCPDCKEELDYVDVFADCHRRGHLREDKIIFYTEVDNISETVELECPKCRNDLSGIIKEKE